MMPYKFIDLNNNMIRPQRIFTWILENLCRLLTWSILNSPKIVTYIAIFLIVNQIDTISIVDNEYEIIEKDTRDLIIETHYFVVDDSGTREKMMVSYESYLELEVGDTYTDSKIRIELLDEWRWF